jgi:hypothetical protein
MSCTGGESLTLSLDVRLEGDVRGVYEKLFAPAKGVE